MEAGRGSYICGLVLGVAVGVAGTHVALSGRSTSPVRLPELSIAAPFESALAATESPALSEVKTAFAPPPSSTVHAIATSPTEVASPDANAVEPPRPLPKVEDAAPLPTEPGEDPELRAYIRDELQTLAASEHDVWYETLRGLSREDASEILRIWKLTRGIGSGPISPALKQFAALPVEKLVSQSPAAQPAAKSKPHEPQVHRTHIEQDHRTHNENARRLCSLNLANTTTPGYKSREVMVFEQTDSPPPAGLSPAPIDTWINLSQGRLARTERILDCAIDGPGFFQVNRGDESFLTRCGRFVLDDEGRIALPRSHGAPCPLEPTITVPGNCERLQIQLTGEVTAVVAGEARSLGKIELFNVFAPSTLEPAGDNLFRTTAASGTPTPIVPTESTQILQGAVEESNVDAELERRKLDALANSPL